MPYSGKAMGRIRNGRHQARPVGIDLFAGAGGLSLGFEQAGFDVVAAVEVDPVHCAAHKYNHPHTAIVPHSVERLTPETIRKMAGLGNRPVDCVFGGPPCQGFSLMGQRAMDDPRNRLVREFVRLVSGLRARYFVFENVKGLTVGRHRGFLDELAELFQYEGYELLAPWRVLNAGHYGVPQFRERLILMGCRKGEPLPKYPDPISNMPDRKKIDTVTSNGPSCLDALEDLPDAERFTSLCHCDAVGPVEFGNPSLYAAELRCDIDGGWHFGYRRIWDSATMSSSARTNHTEISRRRFAETKPGDVEPISRFFRLPFCGVSNTLRAGTDGARGAFTSPRPIHYRYSRCVTVREMARLHGFPDWYRFNATKWHGARQVGNSVPPPLARVIAGEVVKSLGMKPTMPDAPLALGDERLLSLDATASAAHFGVCALPSRRDRASGARKRRQGDIEKERLARQIEG